MVNGACKLWQIILPGIGIILNDDDDNEKKIYVCILMCISTKSSDNVYMICLCET